MEEQRKQYNWFLIMSSWEKGADDEAVKRFHDVYKYLKVLAPPDDVRQKTLAQLARKNPEDPRLTLVPESLKALNLIGRRKFVIICQTTSNRVLQELSKMISLGASISVEIFPATYVYDLEAILPK